MTTSPTLDQVVIGGLYRHYKNQNYRVLGVARHSETLEELVVYECLYENKLGTLWVRPKELFLGSITTETYSGPRFRYVPEAGT